LVRKSRHFRHAWLPPGINGGGGTITFVTTPEACGETVIFVTEHHDTKRWLESISIETPAVEIVIQRAKATDDPETITFSQID
jgi:hypothetical protein